MVDDQLYRLMPGPSSIQCETKTEDNRCIEAVKYVLVADDGKKYHVCDRCLQTAVNLLTKRGPMTVYLWRDEKKSREMVVR